MKKLIVICSTIILGMFLFDLIAGDGNESLKSLGVKAMNEQINMQRAIP